MKHRATVLLSLPLTCSVCNNDRRVALQRIGMRGAGVVRCPHCSASPEQPIPIYVYPMLDEQPRGAA